MAAAKAWRSGIWSSVCPLASRAWHRPSSAAGPFEVACARELGIKVVAYDIFDILVNFWRELLHDPAALADSLAELTPDKATYKAVKARLQAHWQGEIKLPQQMSWRSATISITTCPTDLAFLGWMSKIYEQPKRYDKLLQRLRDFTAPGMAVACLSFEQSIPLHQGEFSVLRPALLSGRGQPHVSRHLSAAQLPDSSQGLRA